MVVRSQMSVLTGLLAYAFVRLLGLENALEWGVMTFVLNYIPFLGPLIATLFPTAFALIQFESWQTMLFVFLGLNLVQTVVGSYIEPLVSGAALSISPPVVVFSVVLWSFFWGLYGAFIGVPIMIALLTFCALFPATRWIAEVLGGKPQPA
jgi:AI-2 transport protein TqsA